MANFLKSKDMNNYRVWLLVLLMWGTISALHVAVDCALTSAQLVGSSSTAGGHVSEEDLPLAQSHMAAPPPEGTVPLPPPPAPAVVKNTG